ncbi:PD40 domain-containing protein [Massilia sp. BSC265]|uniref:TolB family protein n=1 Tax=Massilia sp. BSC265 TaxID=1549812 RepID=UPI0004E9657E|nr:PD40 domain-containing protein [Massilia sp. BSC265]KFI07157.1 hypothetical protein JN27_11430 [Massilia sp. BSC265]
MTQPFLHKISRALAPISLLAVACPPPALAADAPSLPLAAKPRLVGEGTVSGPFHDFAPALTADGRTLLFTRTDVGFSRMTLMQARLVNGKWEMPTVLPFSGRWNDGDGALSPDGARYVFISNRTEGGAQPKADLDLWQVMRQADGSWGEPTRLPDHINSGLNETYPSLAADGTLYFGRAGGGPILRAKLVNGAYAAPEPMPFTGMSFAIAPDQSFGILAMADANRNIDLFHVGRDGQAWSAPRRLDGPVNSPQMEFTGSIGADGKTLLFSSTRRDAGVTWPRQGTLRSAADVDGELLGVAHNGLRNIYSIDLPAFP